MLISTFFLSIIGGLFVVGCLFFILFSITKMKSFEVLAGKVWITAASVLTVCLALWICGVPVL